MPARRTTATAESTGTPASRSRRTGTRKTQPSAETPAAEPAIPPLQTFGEHTGSRPFPVLAETDEKLNTRSFQIPIGVVERLRATADAIQHRAYETELEDRIPDSISGLLVELINAGCTYYEDLFNNGQPFRRVRKLPPGPGRSGAQRGAARRSEVAAAKRAAKSTSS